MHWTAAIAGLLTVPFLLNSIQAEGQNSSFPSRLDLHGPPDAEGPRLRMMAAAVVGPSATCAEREPNETRTQANTITIPGTCTGEAASTDASAFRIEYETLTDGIEDLYILTLPVAAQLVIDLTYSQSAADLDVILFAPGSTPTSLRGIAGSTSRQAGQAERIAAPSALAAGTYYIGVSAVSGFSPYTLSVSAPGYSESCTPDERSLCLNNGRFRVTTHWRTADNRSGAGQSSLMTGDTGYFWFFDRNNVEAVVKVLDACSFNNRFWVFAGGLTDVEVQLRVTDTVTQASKEYTNPLGRAFQPVTDTGAFATCSGTAPPPLPCTYSISQSSRDVGSGATTGSFNITAPSHCSWTAVSNATWITITGGATGSGNGTVSYSVAANTQTTTRSGTITAGGQTFTINQAASTPSCSYTLSPPSQSFGASGGIGSISVTAGAGCNWTASSSASWISITGSSSGSGNGTINYSVAANTQTTARSGTISAGGQTSTINQAAGSAPGPGGVSRLYLSPLLDFRLRPSPPASASNVELCLSTMTWSATLMEDMNGTTYRFNLGVKTANNSSGSGTLGAEILLRRGSTDTILASTTFTTTSTYEVKRVEMSGPDPNAQAGDQLVLRVRIVPPSAGIPCVTEYSSSPADNYIEVPQTAIAP